MGAAPPVPSAPIPGNIEDPRIAVPTMGTPTTATDQPRGMTVIRTGDDDRERTRRARSPEPMVSPPARWSRCPHLLRAPVRRGARSRRRGRPAVAHARGRRPQGPARIAPRARAAVRGRDRRAGRVRPAARRSLCDGRAGAALAAGTLGIGELDMLATDLPTADDLLDSADDAPAIRLINGIIADAARKGVSDIHIEPYETGLVVRMRIDGVLREKLRMPPHVAPVLVSRIKVMARLDIAERRVPQDGRIGLTLGGKLLDVRVSTLPSRAGERVVLRILDKDNAGIDLDVLGMTPGTNKLLKRRAGRAQRHHPGHRADRFGQDHDALCRAAPAQRRHAQYPDGRGPGRICDRGRRPDAGQSQGRADLRGGAARDPAAGSRRGDGRRNPRPRDRRDRGPGLADRASRAVDRPHQRCGRRDHADARHEGRAVPARLHAARGDRPAAGAAAVRALPQGRCRRSDRSRRCSGSSRARRSTRRRVRACSQTGFKGRIGVFEAVRIDETIRRMINDGGDEAAIARHAFANSPNLAAAARAAGARRADHARGSRPRGAARCDRRVERWREASFARATDRDG